MDQAKRGIIEAFMAASGRHDMGYFGAPFPAQPSRAPFADKG